MIVLIISLVCILSGLCVYLFIVRKVVRCTDSVEAVVSDMAVSFEDKRAMYYPVYSFTYNGSDHEKRSSIGVSGDVVRRVGDKLVLNINPENTDDYYDPVMFFKLKILVYVFVGVGIGIFVVNAVIELITVCINFSV